MQHPGHAELWRRIEAYDLDAAGAALPFSARLARDNGWSRSHARRVVREYKRFVYLALTAGHPVTPSEAVDQAWHEHLVYTRSYWDEWCGRVLRRPLHHEPTQGGPAEQAKFRDQYAATLESYHAAFGADAPEDIWPGVAERFAHASEGRWVNQAEAWIVPKPRGRGWRWLLAGGAGLSLAGCGSVALGAVWPYSLDGGGFLAVWPVLWLAAQLGAWWWRRELRGPDPGAVGLERTTAVDAYLVAYVSGGVQRVLFAALARLQKMGALRIEVKGEAHLAAEAEIDEAALHPVERAIWKVVRAQGAVAAHLRALPSRLVQVLEPLEDEAVQRGWIVPEARRKQARVWPWMLALAPGALGLLRVAQGLSAHRPIGFLVAMLVGGTLLTCLVFGRRVWLTRVGAAQRRAWQRECDGLRRPSAAAIAAPGLLVLAVGLFGVEALCGSELDPLYQQLMLVRQRGAGDSGSGCSSGSSTDGTGGAAGCGSSDGGGGGSGCGGCGGGGGD